MEEQKGRSSRGSIESPLGRVNISSSGQKRPMISVDDPTDPVSPEGQYVQESSVADRRRAYAQAQAREERAAADARVLAEEAHRSRVDERMESGAKKRTEILLGLGRGVKDVDVEGIIFSLRTLKNYEWKDAIKAVALSELAIEQAYEMRAQTLSRSIFAIDSQSIEMVLGSSELDDKIDFVQNLDEAVVSYLYDSYNKLVAENKSKFNINSPEGIQEVVEEIKK